VRIYIKINADSDGNEVIGQQKIHNKRSHNLCLSLIIALLVKSRRTRH
jgi:hypothetical protein